MLAAFGLEGHGMPNFFGGEGKRERHAVLGIAIDPVGVELLHQVSNC
jgi:hypothetical protein